MFTVTGKFPSLRLKRGQLSPHRYSSSKKWQLISCALRVFRLVHVPSPPNADQRFATGLTLGPGLRL